MNARIDTRVPEEMMTDPYELRRALPEPRRMATLRLRPSVWRYAPGLFTLVFSDAEVITRLEINSVWIYITVAGERAFICLRRKTLVDVDLARRTIAIVDGGEETVYSAVLLSRHALTQLERLL